ncbi:proline-rich protein 5 [Suricata suricatta]|uniref:proline-rich protein 5 n=1 Tax=Suricata suricatta TaxID=37032 RepID=UPI001155BF9B|nr:proline-rich protein 5 [Suricata suricatta]
MERTTEQMLGAPGDMPLLGSLLKKPAGHIAARPSIHNGVIAIFQRKGLPDQELFSLNEGVRQLLKTELGSFLTEYLQNQLLTKGMVILRDKIRFYEARPGLPPAPVQRSSEKRSFVRPSGVVPGAPVSTKPPSRGAPAPSNLPRPGGHRAWPSVPIRNPGLLRVPRPDSSAGFTPTHRAAPSSEPPQAPLHRPVVITDTGARAKISPPDSSLTSGDHGVPPSSRGVSDTSRAAAVQSRQRGRELMAASRPDPVAVCLSVSAEKHLLRRSRPGDVLAKNPVVRSKSYNTPLLNPVAEHEAEAAAAGGSGVRRHSVSEMTSCLEPQGFSDTPGQGPTVAFRPSPVPPTGPCPSRLHPPAQPPEPCPDPVRGSPSSSSPENLVDQILESVDSDSEGIFIDFGRGRGSGTSEFEGTGGRQSIV